MAVTDFNILANGTWGPRIAPNGTRTYRVTLEAITDSEMSGPAVIGSTGMPVKYGSHADDPLAICVSVEAEQDEDDHNYWVLVYDYTTAPEMLAQAGYSPTGGLSGAGAETPQVDDDNPLNNPPVIKLRTKKFKKLRLKDLDGLPITNQAGDFFEPTVVEVPRLVIDITRNLASFDPTLIAETVGAVNVGPFWGYDFRQVMCEDLTADVVREKNASFWSVHGVFVVAQPGDLIHIVDGSGTPAYWYEWKLNAGYHYLDSGVLKPIFIGGQRPARPQLLTATGGLAAVGASPIYLGFRVLPDASFSALGLFD